MIKCNFTGLGNSFLHSYRQFHRIKNITKYEVVVINFNTIILISKKVKLFKIFYLSKKLLRQNLNRGIMTKDVNALPNELLLTNLISSL